jgi:4-aminobutyrate aminotransferase
MTSRDLTKSQTLLAREAQSVGASMKIRFYPFVQARAHGVHVEDLDGNQYLDFVGAGGVAQLGYGHPVLREAIDAELAATWSTMHCCYPTEPATILAEMLCAMLPGDFDKKVLFGTTGSDANDALAKLLPRATHRQRLVTYVGAYHGQTAGSSGISGHSAQAGVVGAGNVTKVPYPHPYRCDWGPCDPQGCSLKCLTFLERYAFRGVSPGRDTAAVIMEPIQSDGGDIVPPLNYIPALRDLCDEYGVWLVFDEVKTGMGRTGTMFAFEQYGVLAEAVSLGKPLGGGLPLSAVLGRAELLDQDVMALSTLGGSPVPTAAGIALIQVLDQEDLLANATARGTQIIEGLRVLQNNHPLIGDVRGRGLIVGMELVTDQLTREPAARDAARLVYRCFQLGLLVIYCGLESNVIEFTPPLVIGEAHVEQMLVILDQALSDIETGRFDDKLLDGYSGW